MRPEILTSFTIKDDLRRSSLIGSPPLSFVNRINGHFGGVVRESHFSFMQSQSCLATRDILLNFSFTRHHLKIRTTELFFFFLEISLHYQNLDETWCAT